MSVPGVGSLGPLKVISSYHVLIDQVFFDCCLFVLLLSQATGAKIGRRVYLRGDLLRCLFFFLF